MQTEQPPTHIYTCTQLHVYTRVWPLLCFCSSSIPWRRADVLGPFPHAHLPGRAGLPQEPAEQGCGKPQHWTVSQHTARAAAGPARSSASCLAAALPRLCGLPDCSHLQKNLVSEITSGIGWLMR